MARRNIPPAAVEAPAPSDGEKAASARSILALVAKIGKAANKLQVMIHTCAMQAMVHAQTYGDANPMGQLYLILPNGQRREALVDWVHANSPIVIRDKGKRIGITPADEKGFVAWNLEQAQAVPYYEKDERALKPAGEYDPVKALEQKIKGTKERMAEMAKPENSNVVYFKEDFDPVAALATWERQLAALKAA